jgi:hypothetical protein
MLARFPGRSVLGALLAAGTACSSSQFVRTWYDTSAPTAAPMRDVLVIDARTDIASRELWEHAVAGALVRQGIKATPSHELFPGALPDTQQAIAAVRAHGFDGVIVTHRLSIETRSVPAPPIVPGDITPDGTGRYHLPPPGPPVPLVEVAVQYEIDAWRTGARGQLIWTGTTRTINPASRAQVQQDVTALAIPEMVRLGILPAKP